MKSEVGKIQFLSSLLLLLVGLGFSNPAWVAGKGGKASSSSGQESVGVVENQQKPVEELQQSDEKTKKAEQLAIWLHNAHTHRAIPVWDDLPHLKVRATDYEMHDSEVRETAREVLDPMLDREINPDRMSVALTLHARDSNTESRFNDLIPSRAREKGQQFVALLNTLTDSNTSDGQQVELFKPWAGELIVLIGHRDPRTGLFEYMTEEGGKARVIDIFALEERAAEAGVLLLAIGCRSAHSATFGSERDINSVEVVEDLASGITAISTGKPSLRTLYGALATERMALSIDLLNFKDTRRLETVDERGNVLGAAVGVPPLIALISSLTESASALRSIYAPSRAIVQFCPERQTIGDLFSVILGVSLAIVPAIFIWEINRRPEVEVWREWIFDLPIMYVVSFYWLLISLGMDSAFQAKLGYTLLTLLVISAFSLFFTWGLAPLRSRWFVAAVGVLDGCLVILSFLFAFLCGPK